jgi:hypothetical protein
MAWRYVIAKCMAVGVVAAILFAEWDRGILKQTLDTIAPRVGARLRPAMPLIYLTVTQGL